MDAQPVLVKPRFTSELDPIAALLTARACLGLKPAFNELNENVYSEFIRHIIGIAPLTGNLSRGELKPLLKIRTKELVSLLPSRKTILARNVSSLKKLLNLDKQQAEILALVALAQHHRFFSSFFESLPLSSFDALIELLSIALNTSESDIRNALRPEGQLLSTRIVNIESDYNGRHLELSIPCVLRAALFRSADNIETLMNSFLESAPRPGLKEEAFPHVRRETNLLTAYLSKVSAHHTAGVNVLIYGPPGTGKTEYVRWLATHLGKKLYQVRATDDQGDATDASDRLAFFQLSQRFLQKSDALLLFDEITDIFPTARSHSPVAAGKLFINRLLESNPVPTIWVANEIDHIDRAYLRRFDFSFEMSVPPIAVRRDILRQYFPKQTLSDATLTHLSQQNQLSPAQVEKAAKVVKHCNTKPAQREAILRLVIENSMELLGQEKNEVLLNLEACRYDLSYLNPDCDLTQLVEQLKHSPKSVGALCFYGAPGTGKTALAHYLARTMALPLFVQRASDIISPYVGETEQKIAGMFRQAQQDGALLLLDEADSFLSERQSAKNAWEVTAVNEMLTQMERFDGLFICSTNLMERLDAASLRRFALKIKFDYLQPEQCWKLFVAQTETFPSAQEAQYRAALMPLNQLTPGDFATIRRQTALLNIPLTADEMLPRLIRECQSKSHHHSPRIGFHV